MQSIASILRVRDNFQAAVEYLKNILKIDVNNGDVWGSLGKISLAYDCQNLCLLTAPIGHCYLMLDNLQEAYSAYQQALYHLQDPKVCEVKLWSRDLWLTPLPGAKTMVWHRHTIRSLWLPRSCRRGFLASHAHGA